MCGKIDCFITAFSQLRVDEDPKCWSSATTCRDPHKPYLLLSILELVGRKKITKDFIELTLELEETFAGYWQKTMPSGSSGSMAKAFCHMKDEPFWTLVPRAGVEVPSRKEEYTWEQIKEFYLGARLDKELFPLLLMEPLRRRLKKAVVQAYFAPEMQLLLLAQDNAGLTQVGSPV